MQIAFYHSTHTLWSCAILLVLNYLLRHGFRVKVKRVLRRQTKGRRRVDYSQRTLRIQKSAWRLDSLANNMRDEFNGRVRAIKHVSILKWIWNVHVSHLKYSALSTLFATCWPKLTSKKDDKTKARLIQS